MMKCLCCYAALFFISVHAYAGRSIPFFVTTEWLSEHLADKDLAVLQVGFSRNEFRYGHIPGARFLWINSLAPATPDLNTEMPAVTEAQEVLEQLGLSSNSRIVLVFNGQNVPTTTRMFLALTYFGFGDQTALLDGGFELWKSEGRPVSKEDPEIRRTSLELTPLSGIIADADWVRRNCANPAVTIVDARAKIFYDGNGGGIARQGHIKGAKHLAFNSVLDSANRIKSPDELKKLFEDAGIRNGSTIVSYCHVGQQATVVFFAARYLGYEAKVYDGSFEDWNVRDESYPVEKTEAAKE